jgi:drug/metabolite transporter superfamily protein YnfA
MALRKRFISKLGIFGELLGFLWHRKLWWMIPMVIVLVLFGILLVFTQSSAIAPFIYSLF